MSISAFVVAHADSDPKSWEKDCAKRKCIYLKLVGKEFEIYDAIRWKAVRFSERGIVKFTHDQISCV